MIIRNPRMSNRDLMKIEDLPVRHQVIDIEDRLLRVLQTIDAYSWLAEGRGPYAYDDPGYDKDVRRMMRELFEAAS